MVSIKEKETVVRNNQLGIIIVHYGNNKSRTIECLNSFIVAVSYFKKQKPSVETKIIIADNTGNFDLNYQEACPCTINTFKPTHNLGYAGACFESAKLLNDCSHLVFSNNDVILTENSLLILYETLISLENVGAIQPLVLFQNSSNVDSYGLTTNALTHGFNYCNWPVEPIKVFSLKNGLKVAETFGVDGMLIMISKRVWEEVGGWDPIFFMFNEDSLLSWKLRMRGFGNFVAINSVIYHDRGSSAKGYHVKEDPIFSSYYTTRNKILTTIYVHESFNLILYLFFVIIIEFIKNIVLSINNKSGLNLFYNFRALSFVFNNRRHINFERGKIKRNFNVKDFLNKRYIIPLAKSIVWIFSRRNTK